MVGKATTSWWAATPPTSFGDRAGPGWTVLKAGCARADEPACEIVHAVQNGKTFRVAIDVGKFGQDVEKERRQIVC